MPSKKGQSDDPAGKKPGARNRATQIAEALLHEHAPDILRGVINRALAGDPLSIKLCLEQILPRRRGRPIQLRGLLTEADADLVQNQLLITNQMLSGEVSTEEALEVSVVAQMDGGDNEQLRRRLAELKAKIGPGINIEFVDPDDRDEGLELCTVAAGSPVEAIERVIAGTGDIIFVNTSPQRGTAGAGEDVAVLRTRLTTHAPKTRQ